MLCLHRVDRMAYETRNDTFRMNLSRITRKESRQLTFQHVPSPKQLNLPSASPPLLPPPPLLPIFSCRHLHDEQSSYLLPSCTICSHALSSPSSLCSSPPLLSPPHHLPLLLPTCPPPPYRKSFTENLKAKNQYEENQESNIISEGGLPQT